MKPKFKLYDILEITWVDSHSYTGWKTSAEIEEEIKTAKNDFTIKTLGYFYNEDDDFLRVCQCHDNQSASETRRDNVDSLYAVAKPCIKKIKVIKCVENSEKSFYFKNKKSQITV